MASKAPYTLYTAATPNGMKAHVVMEEAGAQYEVQALDFGSNQQKEDWFLKINPNGRIPALVDHSAGDQRVFETGSIAMYIAKRHPDSGLMPKDPAEEAEVISWIMWQMGGQGPMMGQANHFVRYAPEKIGYAMRRYVEESKRLLGVLESHLSDGREWLVGSKFTLADAMCACWPASAAWGGSDIAEFPKTKAWVERCFARPAFKRACNVPKEGSAGKMVYNEEFRKEVLAEARKLYHDAGADQAAEGSGAAFKVKAKE